MNKEKIEIFGRKYLFITMAEADTLENFRIESFLGTIDANTCERNCYLFIFTDKVLDDQRDISGLIKKLGPERECGAIWVANHQKQTLTYDGIRSMRTIESIRLIGAPDYPCLISREEYENFIKYYSHFFGPFFHRIEGVDNISKPEFENAQYIVEEYNKQVLTKRRARKPKFGDFVITLDGQYGRYIGSGQALSISNITPLKRDLIDIDIEWIDKLSVLGKKPLLPTDSDIINYIRDNNWTIKD